MSIYTEENYYLVNIILCFLRENIHKKCKMNQQTALQTVYIIYFEPPLVHFNNKKYNRAMKMLYVKDTAIIGKPSVSLVCRADTGSEKPGAAGGFRMVENKNRKGS